MNKIPDYLADNLSYTQKLVLAAYSDHYAQHQEIVVEDMIHGILLEDALIYGIRSKIGKYSLSTYTRSYILFIDNPLCFGSEGQFAVFAEEYCIKFLPKNTRPSFFAFKFQIESYQDYADYIGVIVHHFKGIQPFYTFSNLVKKVAVEEKIKNYLKQYGSSYEIVIFDKKAYRELFYFLNSSRYEVRNYITLLKSKLDEIGHGFTKNTLIINEFSSSSTHEQKLASLALAYYTDHFKIPVLIEYVMLDEYIAQLKRFNCDYTAYCAYDRIQVLLQFPVIAFAKRNIADFLMYLYPDERKLSAEIEYLEHGMLITATVNLFECELCPLSLDHETREELLALENALIVKRFLHIGNSVHIVIDEIKRFVSIKAIHAEYSAIAYSCDAAIKPFKLKLNQHELFKLLPWSILRFHKGDNKIDLQEQFIGFLNYLNKSGSLPGLSFKSGISFYKPEYTKDGLGCFISTFTEIFQTQNEFDNIDLQLMNQFDYYNISMRNYIVDRIAESIPLAQLHNQSDYLTIYGAKKLLSLNEELLRTKQWEDSYE